MWAFGSSPCCTWLCGGAPSGDGVSGGLGLLEMNAVARRWNDRELGVGDASDETLTEFGELRVVFADEDEHRAVDLTEAVPERSLGARSRRPEAGGQTGCGVAEAVGSPGGCLGEPIEQRVGQPLVDECGNANLFDVIGEATVGAASSCAFVGIVDAGRGADQHQALDGVGMVKCSVQRHQRRIM